MTTARRTAAWAVGGAVFVGIAFVAAATSAWPGMVAALLLATVQFTVAAVGRSSGESGSPATSPPPTVDR